MFSRLRVSVHENSSDGSRGEGENHKGRQPIIMTNVSQKLHENEKKTWTRGGGGGGLALSGNE